MKSWSNECNLRGVLKWGCSSGRSSEGPVGAHAPPKFPELINWALNIMVQVSQCRSSGFGIETGTPYLFREQFFLQMEDTIMCDSSETPKTNVGAVPSWSPILNECYQRVCIVESESCFMFLACLLVMRSSWFPHDWCSGQTEMAMIPSQSPDSSGDSSYCWWWKRFVFTLRLLIHSFEGDGLLALAAILWALKANLVAECKLESAISEWEYLPHCLVPFNEVESKGQDEMWSVL